MVNPSEFRNSFPQMGTLPRPDQNNLEECDKRVDAGEDTSHPREKMAKGNDGNTTCHGKTF